MNAIIEKIEKSFLKKEVPSFRVGDVLRLDVKIVEGGNERVQAFEGVVIRKRGHGVGATFTVRKISFGVGVERTFPLHSPRIDNFKVLRSGKVRRARLYFLRNLSGKAARIEEETSGETRSAANGVPVKSAEPKMDLQPVAAPAAG